MSDNQELIPLFPDTESDYHQQALVPANRDAGLVKRERDISNEAHIQRLVMEFQRVKTVLGLQHIGELHRQGAITFEQTLAAIFACTEANGKRSREFQHYLDEFRQRQVQKLAIHVSGIVDTGAANILVEVQRALYAMSEPERKSFLRRLFGG